MQCIRSIRSRRVSFPFAAAMTLAFATGASAQQFQDQTATRFPSPNPADYTNYIAVGDVDLDGDLDLVFANGGDFSAPATTAGVLRVFINNGAGVFTDESSTRVTGISGYYRGVDLGDADGDGDEDMIIVSDFNRRPRLLINNGSGVFGDESTFRLPALSLSSTRGAFADIDNDGDLDLYLNHGGTTNRFGCGQNVVLVNNGAGVYANETATRHPLGNVCQPMDVIFGDIDNDFDLDIRTGNRGTNNSKLYRNDGAGVFTLIGGVPADSNCYSYDFGDFNGDGLLDMIGANAGPSNQELLLQGDGTGGFTNVSGNISPNTTGDDNDSKFFDLDNDGDLDLVVAALFQSREKIFINNGAGSFTQNTTIITSVNDASLDVAVADFNNDGRPDIVTGQGEGGSFLNRVYINTTGAPDTIPPDVARTEQHPDTDDTVGPYVVRAAIFDGITSDRGFFDRGVTLHYTVNGGGDQTVPMPWNGNSLWRGEIPGQASGSLVEYHVMALDYASNLGTGQTLSFLVGGFIPGDLDGDGDVDINDLLQLLGAWGPCPACPEDLNGDNVVDILDLLMLLANWS